MSGPVPVYVIRRCKSCRRLVTGPDGTEHKCAHWGHETEKAAKACSRKLARDNHIDLETPSAWREQAGTSDAEMLKAVREHFGDEAQGLTDADIVAALGWTVTTVGAFAKIRKLIPAETKAEANA